YTVRVHQKIKEMVKEGKEGKEKDVLKERIQIFEGLVIKVGHGEGVEKNITVRKVVEGIGVEKVFLLHSSNIAKFEVKKKGDVRRSKLYYMRERSGKSARLHEHHVTDLERADEEARMEALIQEAVLADEKRKVADAEVAAKQAAVDEGVQVKAQAEEKPAA
ncbi:50S ribosomal protein L19, partial [Candidatus Peregrinibacteria bacterium]|nr:50S ribosomal protein L19 [Candidatus Peregrinibacteria bacterium]